MKETMNTSWWMRKQAKSREYEQKVYLPLKKKAKETLVLIKKNSEMKDILSYLEARHLLILDHNKNASDVHAEQLLEDKEDNDK